MTAAVLVRLAMLNAALMLAHLWAAKSVRASVFLDAWDATYLPAMALATAIAVLAAIPVYSRLLSRFGPRRVVPIALVLSAIGHAVEWQVSPANRWVAAAVYLHIAGFGALLLSGFWSLASELFDTQSAKTVFGRIAAAGTVGGMIGGVAIERVSVLLPADAALVLLSAFHFGAAAASLVLGRQAGGAIDRTTTSPPAPIFDRAMFQRSPHLRTIAALVGLSTAAAFLIEYLFQAGAERAFPDREDLQPFLARFYLAVGLVTSAVQLVVGSAVRRLGLGRTITSLPLGLGLSTGFALVFQAFPLIAIVRGIELVLRASLYRSGYELLFVPMDPDEKRRSKTFLDVACDRAGDALGALIVQALLVAVPISLAPFLPPTLLAIVIALSATGLWLGRRLDRLYLGVVERRLTRNAGETPVVVPSEVGWSVMNMPTVSPRQGGVLSTGLFTAVAMRSQGDARLAALAELRSGDLARVRGALARLDRPDRMQIAQVVNLLAWDDVVPDARAVLERHAAQHAGLLADALLDPATDFAVRRRLPRVLAHVGSARAVNGLVQSLGDDRFEVRYQSARALDRLLRHHPDLDAGREAILVAVERELVLPEPVWRGQRLIDGADPDDETGPGAAAAAETVQGRSVEHVFTLLGTILPRDAVQAARRGLESDDAHLRALAIEYLEGALPPGISGALRTRLSSR